MAKKNPDEGLGEYLLDKFHSQRDRAGDLCQRVYLLKEETDLSSTAIAAVINDKLPSHQHVTPANVDGMHAAYIASKSTIPLSKRTTKSLVKVSGKCNEDGIPIT